MNWRPSATGHWMSMGQYSFCVESTVAQEGDRQVPRFRLWIHSMGSISACPILFNSLRQAKRYAERTYVNYDSVDVGREMAGSAAGVCFIIVVILVLIGILMYR